MIIMTSYDIPLMSSDDFNMGALSSMCLFYYTLGTHPKIYSVKTPPTIHSQHYWQMLVFYVTKSLARIIGGHPQLNLRKDCVNIPDPLGMLCPDCSTVL